MAVKPAQGSIRSVELLESGFQPIFRRRQRFNHPRAAVHAEYSCQNDRSHWRILPVPLFSFLFPHVVTLPLPSSRRLIMQCPPARSYLVPLPSTSENDASHPWLALRITGGRSSERPFRGSDSDG
jgi:hypothetical protein